MTTGDETPNTKPGKVIQLQPPSAAYSPDRLARVGVFFLPEEFVPQPFTDEQARYVREAAGLDAHAPDLPDNLSQIAISFFMYRINVTTSLKLINQWKEARRKARELLRTIKPLTDDEHLYTALQEFCDEAKRVISVIGRTTKPRRRSTKRERMDVIAKILLIQNLATEFQRLFDQSPTASPQGPFHKFADAFVESLEDNASPASADVKIPHGATLCKGLSNVQFSNSAGE